MQTRKALKSLSKGKMMVDQVSAGGPLAANADWLIKLHDKRETETRMAQRRHASAIAQPVLQIARNKVDEILKNAALPDDTPIVTRFDAFTVVKNASRMNVGDIGLRKMALHLERLWHKDPMGSLSAGALSHLRDHYQVESPRSVVSQVIDAEIPKVSFKNLAVAKLTRIAAQIETQQDFDLAVVHNGLQGDDLKSIRARSFIRALVNRKAQAGPVPAVATPPTVTAEDTSELSPIHKQEEGEEAEAASQLEDIATEVQDVADKLKGMEHHSRRITGKDIASRVASRLQKYATEEPEIKAEPEIKVEPDKECEMGVDGTGMLPINASVEDEMVKQAAQTGDAMWKSLDQPGKKWNTIKSASDKPACVEFEPTVNEQQDPQLKLDEDQGLEVLTKEKELAQARAKMKAAIEPTHPFVDDSAAHFPIHTIEFAEQSLKTVQGMNKSPAWWLGSVDELKQTVQAAIDKEAGKLPAFLEKFKKQPKDKKKDDKKEDKKPKFAEINKEQIEKTLLSGAEFKSAGYSIKIAGDDYINITTKTGSKKYAMLDLDGAIADFIYLASTSKHPAGEPPAPVFFIREGLRLNCPGCSEVNSYEMPKTAEDLTCDKCGVILPSKVVTAALNSGVAVEEAVLVAVTPVDLQGDFGDKFAKAAELLGTNEVGVAGCYAEAYAINPTNEKLAEVWDFMRQAGFKPLAQDVGLSEPMSAVEPGMPNESAMPTESAISPASNLKMADDKVIRSAMEHYKNTGMKAVDAIAQFKKDYGEGKKDEEGNQVGYEFDQELVVKIANEVFGGGADDFAQLDNELALTPEIEQTNPEPEEMPVVAGKKQADVPTPKKINTQQEDWVKAEGLGKDSDQEDLLPLPGKIKTQIKPQGKFSDPKLGPETDSKDPGSFGAGKPQAQHPITDQKGVKLPSTDLGDDSDTGDNTTTKKWDSESAAAYGNQRSAFMKEAADWDKYKSLQPHAQKLIEMSKTDEKASQLLASAEETATQGSGGQHIKWFDTLKKENPAISPEVAQVMSAMFSNPNYYKQVYSVFQKETPTAVAPKKPTQPAQPMQQMQAANFWNTFTKSPA